MVQLDKVDIEGFKGIERLKFDPGRFTVITGRNNSGKTSMLEAIDIALQPSHLARFGPNLDTVINNRFDECTITVGTGNEDRELRLREPAEDNVPDYLLEAFRSELYSSWDSLVPVDAREEEVKEIIDNELPEVIPEVATGQDLEEARNEILLMRVDGVDYPFVYFGPTISDIHIDIRETLGDAVAESIGAAVENERGEGVIRSVRFRHILSRTNSGVFIGGDPSPLLSVNLIDFVQLSKTLDLSVEEADPIKIDNIGDFIKEKGIVDDLKTFDLDYLVFEDEDGGKHSVPFEFMGEGFKTIVGVLWELSDEDRSTDVVLLEEPETHLHPGYVRELIYFLVQVARDDGVQLFATTHNNDFLNDFFAETLTNEEVSFLEAEFRLLQLQEGVADVMDYQEADEHLKDLKLDLRGL